MKKPINKKAFIINLLRRGTYRWPARNEVLKKARISRGQYECKMCGPGTTHDRHSISVDHIHPVVDPAVGFTNFEDYIQRMYCEEDGFQVLCDIHHDAKTAGENQIRKKTRVEKNKDRRAKRTNKKAKTNKPLLKQLDSFLEELELDDKRRKD